ncbi:MAG: DegT/DnrJ/EryC1/StrS family aminotransferase [Planctomycetaceae bacterium]|nr:DegT/DnrJ/EryC1/StrS family aminotransferase [Planctomycetaceae bacterium]
MAPSIRVAEPVLDGNECRYVMDCLESSWISSRGKYIEQFEATIANFCGVSHAIATNNGTTALHLALAAHDLGPDDEVIVPTLTYIASVNAIRYCGARPVFVDSTYPALTMDINQIEEKITPRTRGIVSVSLYGQPLDYHPLLQIADDHNLFVVDDAAEALGARYHSERVGSLGSCATFSFFGNKIITTGEGGMVVTNNPSLAKRLRFLRGQAVSPNRSYWHTDVGFNYRMTNIAAAIGCAQMENIEAHLERRQNVAHWYSRHLRSASHLFDLPFPQPDTHHSYWMYTVLLRQNLNISRDAVIHRLSQRGIETRPIFYPVHWMPPYQEPRGHYPVAEQHAPNGISLPTHGRLREDQVKRVCDELIEVVNSELNEFADPSRQAA